MAVWIALLLISPFALVATAQLDGGTYQLYVADHAARWTVGYMSLEEQRRLLEEKWPEALEEKRPEQKRPGIEALPDLPKVKGGVVVRFAPNPDFVLHLGSARPAILNYAYRLKYGGRFILRFEDTDPRTKRPLVTEEVNAYEAIREDLRWLGVSWDEEYIQSRRMCAHAISISACQNSVRWRLVLDGSALKLGATV